ncbi:uncharacterized protein Bfra_005269 [Botrytis fragariae]|uniref:Uncharacterized protein n=1 Tax=Botrytis fragariae TaxID=1964551 RepID=A0A8H6AUB4_9HELO|nr:uncharacterized protein Bfra_005269 [Botrytis fragariae]KAF5873802.1 hypothetical protein Bfra_005269 [Botrytis fragariae]
MCFYYAAPELRILEDLTKQTRRNGISTGNKVKLDLVTAADWANSSPVVGTSNGGCDDIPLLLQDEFLIIEFTENIRCERKRKYLFKPALPPTGFINSMVRLDERMSFKQQ